IPQRGQGGPPAGLVEEAIGESEAEIIDPVPVEVRAVSLVPGVRNLQRDLDPLGDPVPELKEQGVLVEVPALRFPTDGLLTEIAESDQQVTASERVGARDDEARGTVDRDVRDRVGEGNASW